MKSITLILFFLIVIDKTDFCFGQDTIVLPLENIYGRIRIASDSKKNFDSFQKNNCNGFIYDTITDTVHFRVKGYDSISISSLIYKKDTGCFFQTYMISPGISLNRFHFGQFKWVYKYGLKLSDNDKSHNVYFIKCFTNSKGLKKICKRNDSLELIRYKDLNIISLVGSESDFHLITFEYNTRRVSNSSYGIFMKHFANLDSLLNRYNLEVEFFYFRFSTFSDEENFIELNRTIKILGKLHRKYKIKKEKFVIYLDEFDRKNSITDYYPVLQDTGLTIGILAKKK